MPIHVLGHDLLKSENETELMINEDPEQIRLAKASAHL
jgi:hypothetical protein